MQLQLTDKKQITPDTFSFYFKSDTPFEWRPGQFLRYRIPQLHPDDRGENRFFSIASAPFEGLVQLTTKFAGEKGSSFKKVLEKIPVGGVVEAMGPTGEFLAEDANQEYVFIAGGIGITPFRAMLVDMDHKKISIKASLIYANRTREALFKEELEALARKHAGFKIYYIISDEPIAETQIETNLTIVPGTINAELIRKLVPDIMKPMYYVSGPEPMVLALEKVIWDMGIPKEKTKRDYYPGYEKF